jgi:hypothetical protein
LDTKDRREIGLAQAARLAQRDEAYGDIFGNLSVQRWIGHGASHLERINPARFASDESATSDLGLKRHFSQGFNSRD